MSKVSRPVDSPIQGEPYLLTPGPLTTSRAVKEAALCDWGSWDGDFRALTAEVIERLEALAGQPSDGLECVLLQGSGSYTVEAMLGSFLPRDGKALVLANGAYGQRIVKTLQYLGREHHVIDKGDFLPPRGEDVLAAVADDPDITDVIVVHCETSSGILNPLEEISLAVETVQRRLLVDSMSAFGAVPVDPQKVRYEALVSSANKCIEGIPGFGFVIARTAALEAARGRSHSLSLDVHAQWAHMKKTGQWRFTPPTHVVAAFLEALRAHEAEGGIPARGARYARNRDVLVEGMRDLGFETLLHDRWLSPIIVTFLCPEDEAFSFGRFYDLMKGRGFIIYPGKLTEVDSFRIGCIGQLDEAVMRGVVDAVAESLGDMGVSTAAPSPESLRQRDRLAA